MGGQTFSDHPWDLRADLAMGQKGDVLQVPGFPIQPKELMETGGYVPSSRFADATAIARAWKGMAVFAGFAGPVELSAGAAQQQQAQNGSPGASGGSTSGSAGGGGAPNPLASGGGASGGAQGWNGPGMEFNPYSDRSSS